MPDPTNAERQQRWRDRQEPIPATHPTASLAMTATVAITLWATDPDTGEELFIDERIPATGNPDDHAEQAMNRHMDYDFTGWDFA
jgi:hypothetical protein